MGLFQKAIVGGVLAFSSYFIIVNISIVADQEHSFNGQFGYASRQERDEKDVVVSDMPYFLNKDKLYIRKRSWKLPSQDTKAIMVIVHGLNEHSGRYYHMAKKLNVLGVSVYSLDHQGHGMSEGDRLFVKDFDDYVQDVIHVLREAKKENPGKKVFLWGHSMGGLISVLTTLKVQDEIDFLVATSPALIVLQKTVPNFARPLVHFLAGIFPKLRLSDVPLDTLSKNKCNNNFYMNDPLHANMFSTIRLQSEIMKYQATLPDRLGEIKIPVLGFHGSADGMVPISSSQMLHDKAASKDKTYEEFNQGFHELVNEKDNSARDLILKWVKERL